MFDCTTFASACSSNAITNIRYEIEIAKSIRRPN